MSNQTDKLPPFDIDAEQAILGAVFLDDTAVFTVLSQMDVSDFYRPSHQNLFTAMLDIKTRGGQVDLLTVRDLLESRHILDECGGAAYLVTLADVVPTAANIESHIRIVREKSVLRQLAYAGQQIYADCLHDGDPYQDILHRAETSVFAVTQRTQKQRIRSYAAIIPESFQMIEDAAERQGMMGIPTGFCDVDALIPGLEGGKLYYLAARPSMGKTALALNILEHVALVSKLPVLCFSREMLDKELGFRSLCCHAKVDSSLAKRGRLAAEDWERLTTAAEVLSHAPLFLDDSVNDSILDVCAKARRAKIEQGIALVAVDYLQLLQWHQRVENRNVEVMNLSRTLKLLSLELDIPVLCLSQLSRDVEKRSDKRPQLSDLRDSGAVEQDADVVMFLYRPEMYSDDAPKGVAELIVAKQRGGAVGTVHLGFFPHYTQFYSLETNRTPF